MKFPSPDAHQVPFRSDYRAMWIPFVTKLIFAWGLTYIGVLILTGIFAATAYKAALVLILPAALLLVTWQHFREVPLLWRTAATFDLTRRELWVSDHSRDRETGAADLLDADGRHYRFEDIEGFHAQQYESFVSRVQYLLKIRVGGRQVRLLSLRSADEYSKCLQLLREGAKLSQYR